MDGYTFVDIFDTKGIEYILVLIFLVAFVFFMRALTSESQGPGRGGGKRDETKH